MKVLIVDDDPEIANLVRQIVSADGHEVSVAERGSQAIQAAIAADYDLLICDLMLPDLQGTEVVRALKAQAPQLPVIVISALGADEYRPKVLEAGASCYLQKPLRIKELRQEIAMVANSRATLRISLIEPDTIHRVRVTKMLEPLGCTVEGFENAEQARAAIGENPPSLLMIEGGIDDAIDTVKWAKSSGIPAFVFCEPELLEHEDTFMRAGAALFMTKPIDTEALLTQARFLANF